MNFFVLNRSALTGICIALLLFMPLSNYAQKSKTMDFVLTACVQDIGNGMYQVTFSYNNPNTTAITLPTDQSVLKKNGKLAGNGVNFFKKGNIISAFRTQFYKTESVEWSVVNPNGKIHIVVATAGSALCPTGQVSDIVPVYGQGNGKDNATKLGLELTSLAQKNAGDEPSEVVYFINPKDATEVLIEIVPKAGQTGVTPTPLGNVLAILKKDIKRGGFGRQYNADLSNSDFLINPELIESLKLTTIDVYFPKEKLLDLIQIADINFVRPSYQAKTNSGIVASQGDKAQKSEEVRNSFRVAKKVDDDGNVVEWGGVDGSGIKVGVISDSFDKYTGLSKEQTDINNININNSGDLPGIPDNGEENKYKDPVEVLMDYPFVGASDEGRAMLQIVHDVAPGAKLAFHTGIQSPRIFELAVQSLQAAKCDIIVDDITFPLEPFFGEGRISTAIRKFTNRKVDDKGLVENEGHLYFTSAGNFANNGYQAKFSASSSTPVTNFLPTGSPALAHVFEGADILNKITLVPPTPVPGKLVPPDVYMLVLQWEEPLASQTNDLGAKTDLDIYLVDDAGNLIVGNNRKNEAGDPTEVIVFEVLPSTKTEVYANIMIVSANGVLTTADLDFKYIAFRLPDLKGKKFTEIMKYGIGAPTVSGHAMTPEAITVAAVDYTKADSPVNQDFSSLGVNGQIDLSAPDGVNTNVASIGKDRGVDDDDFPNFFGTSAAAPHAAGAFALLMSAIPNWYEVPDKDGFRLPGDPGDIVLKTSASADEALNLVKDWANGFDGPERAGAGLIDLEAAFSEIANKTPIITKLIIADKDEDLFKTGTKPYQVSIIGENFTEDTEVLLNGKILDSEDIIIKTENEISIVANIDSYSGNPIVQVQTSPKGVSVNNGGLSPEKPFFEDGRQAISIIAENKIVKYGQKPEFTYTVKLPDGITYAQTGLPPVIFDEWTTYANVGKYTITPSFDRELNPVELANYQVNFVKGILTVEKNNLKIKAADVQVDTYGDKIEVKLEYEFDKVDGKGNALFTDEEATTFRNFIEASHKLDFSEGDINKSILLIDDLMPDTDPASDFKQLETILKNGSWIATPTSISNGQGIGVPNGQGIGVANSIFIPLLVSSFEIEYPLGSGDKVIGIPNGQGIGVPNGQGIGVPNGQGIGVANAFELLENDYFANVVNGQGIGVPNGQGIGVANNGEPITLSFKDIIDRNSTYTVFDEADFLTEFNTVYAVNLITGKSVTTVGKHLIAPGAFLNALSTNFKVTYETGELSIISPKELKAVITDKVVKYPDNLIVPILGINTEFDGFAYNESVATVFPDGIPYYFVSDKGEYNMGEILPFGEYKIMIRDTELKNYTIVAEESKLTVSKATLDVEINDLVINKGEAIDISLITPKITGYVNEEDIDDVFPPPQGITYQFIMGADGAYNITIVEEPVNYDINYKREAKVYVNSLSGNVRKVRTFLDCIEVKQNSTDKFKYIANFRYDNPNSETIYVLHGEDNRLTGEAEFSGETPIMFLPGENTFKIEFDGRKLIWTLTTFDNTQKSSVSSEATSDSGKCDAKGVETATQTNYLVGPNPTTEGNLTIKRKIAELGTVDLFTGNGVFVKSQGFSSNNSNDVLFTVPGPGGLYYLRINAGGKIYMFNIIKN